MAENLEKKSELRITPELLEKIRVKFAEELDERSRKYRSYALLGPNIGERVISGEKVSGAAEDLLIGIGQDFRLNPDEMDELREKFLK